MKKPIFLVGIPRCGSTLWANIIEKSKGIKRFREVHFFNPWHRDFKHFTRRRVGDLSMDENVNLMVDIIFSDEVDSYIHGTFWKENLGPDSPGELKKVIKEKIINSDRSYESIFKIILEEPTKYYGYHRFFVKFPLYLNHIDKLFQWYPDAKVIHITRDPRAIAMSKTKDPGGTARKILKHPKFSYFIKKSMIVFTVIQYNWSARVHKKYSKSENYTVFRYEDLLAKPEKVIKEFCDFAEIRFRNDMLYPREGQASSLTGERTSGFDKNAANRWREIISPCEKIFIDIFTRASMKKLGY